MTRRELTTLPTSAARRQCSKCPWKKSTNPHDIPHGYSETKHRALRDTIAEPARLDLAGPLRIMACHETHDEPCVGWLAHQLGPGNNLALRMAVIGGSVSANVETVGPQHDRFEDTLPTGTGEVELELREIRR